MGGSRIGTAATVLAVFAAFCAIAWFRYASARPSYPAGSTLSTQPDGARALLLWMQSIGLQAQGTQTTPPAGGAGTSDVQLVIEPLAPLLPSDRPKLDAFTDRGGTLVLAGGSGLPIIQSFFSAVGITSSSGALEQTGTVPGGEVSVPMSTHMTL